MLFIWNQKVNIECAVAGPTHNTEAISDTQARHSLSVRLVLLVYGATVSVHHNYLALVGAEDNVGTVG